MDDARHYRREDVETALRESRDGLADLADRIEETGGPTVELSHSEKLLIWMSLKLSLLDTKAG
ncbi:MAG: hypothetical protein KDA93_01460 [Planctomycetaceae bacterium]|nr:hypothetical protein [Planctomycetaceae bacterium]